MRAVILVGLSVACSASPPAEVRLGVAGAPGDEKRVPTGGQQAQPESTGGERSTGGAPTGGAPTGGATGGVQATGGATAVGGDVSHLMFCDIETVDLSSDPKHCGSCQRRCLACTSLSCVDGTCDDGVCSCETGYATIASRDANSEVYVCSADGFFSAATCVESGRAYCEGDCVKPGVAVVGVMSCQCPDGYEQQVGFTDQSATRRRLVSCEAER